MTGSTLRCASPVRAEVEVLADQGCGKALH
jgi:hypothetical protein